LPEPDSLARYGGNSGVDYTGVKIVQAGKKSIMNLRVVELIQSEKKAEHVWFV
jgi:hypothetical protein